MSAPFLAPRPPGTFRLVTLGTVQLLGPDGTPLAGPSVPTAFLVYLHCADGRRARREHLADIFWRTTEPRLARQALRQILTRLRTLLGPDAFESSGGDLCLRAPVASDRDEFLGALQGQELPRAIDVYHGEFFPGFGGPGSAGFEEWAEVERSHLQAQFLRAAEAVILRGIDGGKAGDVLALARRVKEDAPTWEAGRRLLIEVLAARGDLVLAAAEADALLAQLRREGQEPEPTTVRLVTSFGDGPGHELETGQEPGLHAALVGREQEFHLLMTAWREAVSGTMRHLHLVAPAGMGKTRLIQDAAMRIRMTGGRVVAVAARAGERSLDLALGAELALGLGRLPGAVGVDPVTASVLLRMHGGLAATFPGVATGGRDGELRGDAPLTQTHALQELARTVAEGAPLAVFVDDLHWADPASRQIIESLASRLQGSRILLVTAQRSHGVKAASWDAARVINLRPLSLVDIGALLDGLGTFTTPGTSAAVAAALFDLSDGNPLLVLEALQHVMERGDLELHDGCWTMVEPGDLPAALREAGALGHRLAQLGASQHALLVILTVAGTPLSRDELVQLLARPATDLDADLVALERRSYVRIEGSRWVIAHEAVARMTLDSATPSELATAHGRTGGLLAERAASPSQLRQAGHHLAAAHQTEDVIRLFRRWAKQVRGDGDRRSVPALAEDFLGGQGIPELTVRLAKSLPITTRLGLGWQHAVLAGLVTVMAVGTSVAYANRDERRVPDASLIVPVPGFNGMSRLYQVDLYADDWYGSGPIDVAASAPLGERSGWGRSGAHETFRPDGGQMVFVQSVPDSGVTDLFLREESGATRRITFARLDDIDPAWSPDGKSLVFSSARWSAPGEYDLDLAIIDPISGAVRRLTRSLDKDLGPSWSPDGTRIAFIRTSRDELPMLCWVTPDGAREWCSAASRLLNARVLGWHGPARAVVMGETGTGFTHLVEADLAAGTTRLIDSLAGGGVKLSSDGEWGVCACRSAGGSTTRLEVFRLSDFSLRRPLSVTWNRLDWPAWRPVQNTRVLQKVTIQGADPVVQGVAARLWARGRSPAGEDDNPDPAVLSWRVSDTSIATINVETGVLVPRRRGQVRVFVSAGGWVADSILVQVVTARTETVAVEDWTTGWEARWQGFGHPKAVTVPTASGFALWNHGDETFESGVASRLQLAAHTGLGVDATVRMPVSRPIWQRLKLSLGSELEVLTDGVGGRRSSCTFSLPQGEGQRLAGQMSLTATDDRHGDHHTETIPPNLTEGWHWLRMQVFPDGTCGIAIDGRPVWRSSSHMALDGRWSVATSGQSVGTQILVGPMQVWTGVRTDVDWSLLDRK